MPDCPYGTRLSEEGPVIRCQKLSEAVGFIVSICDPHCLAHQKAGGPDVPVEDVPRLATVIRGSLVARLISGDAPEYQDVNPIDIHLAAEQLKKLLSLSEQRQLLHDIADSWSVGGHTAEVVEQKLVLVAGTWGMEQELAVWAEGGVS